MSFMYSMTTRLKEFNFKAQGRVEKAIPWLTEDQCQGIRQVLVME